jgi:hypothetical protein
MQDNQIPLLRFPFKGVLPCGLHVIVEAGL